MKLRSRARLLSSAAALFALAFATHAGMASSAPSATVIPQLTYGDQLGAPPTLDPTKGLVGQVDNLSLETLLKYGPRGTLVPWLAQSVSHPKPTVYVYHLRRGVHFWDGNEMTSTDVANSFNYERNPKAQTAAADFGTSVSSVTSTDRYTVTVTLSHADASWQYVPAGYGTYIFEKKFQDAHPTTMGQPGVLIEGSGPWKIDSYDPTTGAELSANAHWWGGKVNVKHITVKFFADETSLDLAFRAGAIDIAFPRDARAFAATTGSTVTGAAPSEGEGYFMMNTNVAPWNDVHVRRAVAYAINRSDFVGAYGGYATPVSTLIPPVDLMRIGTKSQVSALINSLPQYAYSLAQAKAELAKSAFPHGFTASTEVPTYSVYPTMNQVIAGQLAKIGITLTLNSVPLAKWVSDYYAKTFTSVFVTWFTQNPDASGHPTQILGNTPGNFGSYASPIVTTLLTQGLSTNNHAKRFVVYGKLLKQLALDMPDVPLYIEDDGMALSSKYKLTGGYSPIYTSTTMWPLQLSPK